MPRRSGWGRAWRSSAWGARSGGAVPPGGGAAVNAAQIGRGESVAIFGLGGVGLAALLGAHASGATTLVASDRIPAKLELARELGATHTVMAGPEAVEEV